MKVIFLIDNNSDNELVKEWGLSVYIEENNHRVLLDAGTTGAFADNAKALSVDLKNVEYACLSHAHYDHSDGFPRFFDENEKAKLFVREGSGANCYDIKGFKKKYIGVTKALFKKYRSRIEFVSGNFKICDGFYLIPHTTEGLRAKGRKAHMFRKKGLLYYADDFSHEQSLVVETKKGLVIFNSCSHSGPEVIINEVKEAFPDKKIYGYVGGLHLYKAGARRVKSVAKVFGELGIEVLVTGHCTGDEACGIISENAGISVLKCKSGLALDI